MSPSRKTIAVVCIALVVCAAIFPGGAPEVVWAGLIPLWLIVPAADVTLVVATASRCDEQPTSLLSLAQLRGPPSLTPLT
jgi:hypothetical protein